MSKVYTKKQLISAVAQETDLSQVKVTEVFNATFKIIKKQVKLGYKVKTVNGSIKLVPRKAKKVCNPQTGKKITIPACKKPKFTFSKDFKAGM